MENTPDSDLVRHSIEDHRLDERRTGRYTFTNMKGLIHYFSAWLDKSDINDVAHQAKAGFKSRIGISKDETQLQLLKKCEYTMVRMLRKGARR